MVVEVRADERKIHGGVDAGGAQSDDADDTFRFGTLEAPVIGEAKLLETGDGDERARNLLVVE